MASVLQVATIKASGGNANAIEIANSSANVTVNNLAAGTIGSAVTFPAGHIIQTKIKSYNAAGTTREMSTSTTMTTMDLGQGSLAVTGVTMTENNLCHCTLAGMNLLSVTDNTYSTFIEIWEGSTTRFTYEFYFDQESAVSLQFPLALNFTFVVPASFSNKTISPRARHQSGRPSGSNVFSARTTLEDVHYFFMVQEIQQ